MAAYRLEGDLHLYEWIGKQTDSARVEAMLTWIAQLCETPRDLGGRVPGRSDPVYWAETPDPWTYATYLVIDEWNIVVLIGFWSL